MRLMEVPKTRKRRTFQQYTICIYRLSKWFLIWSIKMFPVPCSRDRFIFVHPIKYLRSEECKGIGLRRDYDEYNLIHYHPYIRFLTAVISFRDDPVTCALQKKDGRWYEWN